MAALFWKLNPSLGNSKENKAALSGKINVYYRAFDGSFPVAPEEPTNPAVKK
jgi:hypothetical protein